MRRINALFQIENTDDGLLGDLEFNTVLNPRGLGVITGADHGGGVPEPQRISERDTKGTWRKGNGRAFGQA